MARYAFGSGEEALHGPYVFGDVIHAWVTLQRRCFTEVKRECDRIIRVSNTEAYALDMTNIESDQETQRD